MKIIYLVFLVSALLMPMSMADAGSPLRIATEGAYPPFNDMDKDGKLIGFDVDIAMALCDAMNRECTIEAVEWDKLLTKLDKREIDVVVASMARTAEREQIAAFTHYYYRSRTTFAGAPDKPFVQTDDGLKGKTIVTQTGTVQEKYLLQSYPSANIMTTETIGESFAMLADGRAFAVLSDSLSIYDFLQTSEGKPFDFVGIPLPANDPSSEACIAVRKTDSELLKALNEALKDIRISGVYDKINQNYFPFSIY